MNQTTPMALEVGQPKIVLPRRFRLREVRVLPLAFAYVVAATAKEEVPA